jgi:hypothetical protein
VAVDALAGWPEPVVAANVEIDAGPILVSVQIDVEACLRAQSSKLNHLGFRGPIARNTLANADGARFRCERSPERLLYFVGGRSGGTP